MEVFLLGGCDLEMCAIKRLLKKYNKKFYDKSLKWGAKLSDYLEEIKKYSKDKIYAIELSPDIEVDENIILIDHHNEYINNPSSLEQVANILNHKLTKFEKAVAINDKSYIDGLIKEKFNLSDIKRIRKLDRKCQGVDEIIEKAAKEIELKRIIYFPYEYFSPLNDRIYFERGWKKYIIYNDNLTMFYGFDLEFLKEELEKMGKKFFFGGGKRGFLGVEEKLEKDFLEKVFSVDKKLISTHIFMLPFVIKEKNFQEKLNDKWKKEKFTFRKKEYYNEFVYFLPHVRDVLYGLDENLSIYKEYELEKNKENFYIIKLKNGKTYELEIEDISLRIFNGVIGILSFHLNNYDYNDPDDILNINEYGRRIFPQFLGENGVEDTKGAFLADKIILKINSKEIVEDFNKFSRIQTLTFEEIRDKLDNYLIPSFIKHLIGNSIELILDDRMFVISFYLDIDKRVIENLKEFNENSCEYSYVNNEWWYKYLFVDGNDKTCQSKILCPNLVKKSTYDRWVEYGTLWGISRYSFVGIGTWDLMITHTKTMYYQIMVLLLMYRAMIVYFSDEVQDIVDEIKRENKKNIREDSKKLYSEYLKFLNGLYFKEVTPQEQGIDIYKKALYVMEIEDYIRDFDREISELDNYIEIEVEKERNEELDKLNKIATIFLPPTLIASFLGMNVGNFEESKVIKFVIVVIIIFLSVLVSETYLSDNDKIILKFLDKFNNLKNFIEKNRVIIIVILIILLVLLGLI